MGRKNKVNQRLGFCDINNQGSKFKVVYYKNSMEVWVKFYNHTKEQTTIVKTTWQCIQNKSVMDIYYPSLYGVGYMGKTTCKNEDGTEKESYCRWVEMLRRCYDSKFHLKNPTYADCEVCKEWKCFANFERDYEELLNENNFPKDMRLQLDKDIIIKGNKVYSKENSVLTPSKLNSMFTKCDKSRGDLPIGVYYRKDNKTNPYRASVSTGIITPNHKTHCKLTKCFPTPEQAFQYYKEQKEQIIKGVATDYLEKGFITEESRLFKALMSYEVDITD